MHPFGLASLSFGREGVPLRIVDVRKRIIGIPDFLSKSCRCEMMMGVETPIPPEAMDIAAPDGAPPRRFRDQLPCPAVPRRGPEAGGHHYTK